MLRIWAVQKHLNERCVIDPDDSVPSVSNAPLVSWLVALLWFCANLSPVSAIHFLICKKRSCYYTNQLPAFPLCFILAIFAVSLLLGHRWSARHCSPWRYGRARSKHDTSSTSCTFSRRALLGLMLFHLGLWKTMPFLALKSKSRHYFWSSKTLRNTHALI